MSKAPKRPRKTGSSLPDRMCTSRVLVRGFKMERNCRNLLISTETSHTVCFWKKPSLQDRFQAPKPRYPRQSSRERTWRRRRCPRSRSGTAVRRRRRRRTGSSLINRSSWTQKSLATRYCLFNYDPNLMWICWAIVMHRQTVLYPVAVSTVILLESNRLLVSGSRHPSRCWETSGRLTSGSWDFKTTMVSISRCSHLILSMLIQVRIDGGFNLQIMNCYEQVIPVFRNCLFQVDILKVCPKLI